MSGVIWIDCLSTGQVDDWEAASHGPTGNSWIKFSKFAKLVSRNLSHGKPHQELRSGQLFFNNPVQKMSAPQNEVSK